ncbi:MAG TPA: CADD family putative folate metabolism protein [Actinomycetota bacterium]|nr:CADD family putative folate metabolism protein [Actinomycetota bacterium]
MDLLERIDAAIDDRHLLTHSFYSKWVAGTLPREALQDYARQYHAFEANFPRFLSALHSRTDRAEHRAALLENLWDEEHGEANHRELWLRFAEGVGTTREEVETAQWKPSTQALVEAYARSSREAPVAAGVAAVYAYERQVPAVAQAKIDGLKAHFDVEDPRTLAFFETHATLDVEHSAAERQIIAEGSGGVEDVLRAVDEALDAWWGFLDGVDPAKVTPRRDPR